MRRIANRMLEWLFPALREWRIEAELEDGGRESGGAPKVNWEKFGERTTKSLRTLFDGWRKMPPAYRATTLDALADAVDRAPEDVLDLLRAKLAERE